MEAKSLLENGGFAKKDSWLVPMHVRKNGDKYQIYNYAPLYEGGSHIAVVETYSDLEDIPYCGKWMACDSLGKAL